MTSKTRRIAWVLAAAVALAGAAVHRQAGRFGQGHQIGVLPEHIQLALFGLEPDAFGALRIDATNSRSFMSGSG